MKPSHYKDYGSKTMHINACLFSAIVLLKLLAPVATQTVVSTGYANLKRYANADCTGEVIAEGYNTLGKCVANADGTGSFYNTFYGDATNGNVSKVYFANSDCADPSVSSEIVISWQNGCSGEAFGAGQVVSTMNCFGSGGVVFYETYDMDTCHEVQTQMTQPFSCTAFYPYNCFEVPTTEFVGVESFQCGGDPNYYTVVLFNETKGLGCSGEAKSTMNSYFGCYSETEDGYNQYSGSTCGYQSDLPNVELTCAASPATPACPASPACPACPSPNLTLTSPACPACPSPACPACPACPSFTCSSNSDGSDADEIRDIASANVGLTVILLVLVSYNVYEIGRRRFQFPASNADVNNPIR